MNKKISRIIKTAIILALLGFICPATAQTVAKLHERAIVVDTHNDCLTELTLKGKDITSRLNSGHSDLYRWKKGALDVQFFSVWTDKTPRNAAGFFHDALEEIDSLHRIILRNPDRITFGETYREIRNRAHKDKLVALIGVEGGHMIEEDLQKLDSLYALGMRYLTLTWNNSTSWASSAMDETLYPEKIKHAGLNDFGKKLVEHLNELGVIVDLSHTGEKTFYDAIAVSKKPVLLSHSSVWSICPVFRNVKDDQIKAVAKNGGVICINFYSGFISKEYDQRQAFLLNQKELLFAKSDTFLAGLGLSAGSDSAERMVRWNAWYDSSMNAVRPTLEQLVDHIDYIVKLVGDRYVGIGSDYDGVSSVPVGLDDVSTYPKITEELLRRGYSNKSIKRILGGNVMRVMKANFR
ncbi:MAG: membrane dipeptidase [Sphingobacteriales bacterium]|nr:membrane dipeptidase [Sphingobacteriales bacterium]